MFNNFGEKMYFIYAVSQVVRITNTFNTEMQNILFSIFVAQLHHIVFENLQLISCCGPESTWSLFPAGPRLTSCVFLSRHTCCHSDSYSTTLPLISFPTAANYCGSQPSSWVTTTSHHPRTVNPAVTGRLNHS